MFHIAIENKNNYYQLLLFYYLIKCRYLSVLKYRYMKYKIFFFDYFVYLLSKLMNYYLQSY